MPVTEQAKRALRHDQQRAAVNRPWRLRYKEAVRKFRLEKTPEALREAQSVLDRAARRLVIHPNRAARLKSRLAKLLTKKS